MTRSFLGFMFILVIISSCGFAQKEPVGKIDTGTDIQKNDSSSIEGSTPKQDEPLHMCASPIEKPLDVWPRIEAIRVLPKEDREKNCGLAFLKLVGHWRCPPIDLMAPIVQKAATDTEAFKDWILKTGKKEPEVAANVLAMHLIMAWQVGDDETALNKRVEKWRAFEKENRQIQKVLAEAATLGTVLKEVNHVHLLRCKLEINPLGFAMDCTPIHPKGKSLKLTWLPAYQDGILVDLKVLKCKGKSCKKLKKGAAEYLSAYKNLIKNIDALETEVYREQLKSLLNLKSFTTSGLTLG